MAQFKTPSKKATIITAAIIIVLLIIAATGTVMFLRDRGTTEAAQIDQEQVSTQNENSETQTAEQPANEEQTTPQETNTDEVATEEGTDVAQETETQTGTSQSSTSTSQGTGTRTDGTTTTTEDIQESTITRTETEEIPERLVSEDHIVGWNPMDINADIASARINPTKDDVEVIKEGDKTVVQGEVVNYTITVKNHTDKKLEGIEVKDVLDDTKLDLIEYKTEPHGTLDGNTIKWYVDIEANNEVKIEFSVKVKTSVAPETKIENSAIANGEESEEVITEVEEAKTSLPVSKEIKAEDSDAAKEYAITGVVVTLDGTDKTVTLNAENEYKAEFTDLKKYDEKGNKITYTVTESAIKGEEEAFKHYKQEEKTEGQFVNTFDPSTLEDTIEISGTKTWNDIGNKFNTRPGSITVNLLADGEEVKDVTIKPDGNGDWKYKFENLPKYNSKGQVINYTISEDRVNNYNYPPTYTETENGYDIENSTNIKETSIEKTATGIIKKGSEVTEPVNETDKYKNETETIYPSQNVSIGDTIIYDIVVKNEGNTTLTNVKVTDDKNVKIIGITPIVNGENQGKEELDVATTAGENLLEKAGKEPKLEEGNGYIITVSYKVDNITNLSEVSNTATITSDGTNPKYSTATVMVEVLFESNIKKEIVAINGNGVSKGEQVDENTIKYNDKASKGDTLTYKITATNNGTTTIEDLNITDDRNVKVLNVEFSSGEEYTIGNDVAAGENLLAGSEKDTLNPGESVEVTVTYVIGSMDGDDKGTKTSEILNTAILEGNAKNPNPAEGEEPYRPVHNEADAIIEAIMKANITIEKTSTTDGQELEAGSKVTYTVTLRNTSSVTGTAVLEESVPENTSLVGEINVETSVDGTENPRTLTEEEMEAKPTLTVPGNGTVTITFTVKLENGAIGTTVENTASIGDGEGETSETIKNDVKKSLNIYETKTKYGQQSVVLVIDMTLSMAADVNTNNTDRLAYAPVVNGVTDYRTGYHNTRWYQLTQALDGFINNYLGNNPGNKKSVAIVGFYRNEYSFGGKFITDAEEAKGVYANVFTEDQYTAAVKLAEQCEGDEGKFEELFDKYEGTSDHPYKDEDGKAKTPYRYNEDKQAYDIDVDLLECDYPEINECELSSGTNITAGLKAGDKLVEKRTGEGIITNAIIITDGIDNSDDEDKIDSTAKDLMRNNVNGVNTKLYAIGFTDTVQGDDTFREGENCTKYFYAEDSGKLDDYFEDIIEDSDPGEEPDTRKTTVGDNGYVSLDGIELSDSSKITFYTGEELTAQTTVVTYENLQALKDSGYYNANANTFNLKGFLSDYNVDAAATINMQVYTVK